MMGWTKIEIALPADVGAEDERFDVLSAFLFELGVQGLEVMDQERPIKVVAAFPPETVREGLLERVQDTLRASEIEGAVLHESEFEAIDWAEHWKIHFKPLSFGRLWVVPSWLTPPEEAKEILWIDPSMAFGTGLHATTAMCLERVVELSPVASMLDVGTGTGILALASLKLGTPRAVGVDNDPEAIEVALENAERNVLDLELGATLPEERFELVVANILAGPLVDLSQQIASRVAPSGKLSLSGVLDQQADEVVKAYVAQGMVLERVVARGEWVRIDLRSEAKG
jgi:ribosomal protein L11 methyltransferase